MSLFTPPSYPQPQIPDFAPRMEEIHKAVEEDKQDLSFGNQYLMKCEMMLITAKVSGGNSGGPVINDKGCLVGITSCLTDGEGDYDNLGYGMVSPVKYLLDIVPNNDERKEYDISRGFFRDWKW